MVRPSKPVTPTQSAYEHPSAHHLAIVELTKRYLSECRNDIRTARTAGKPLCLPRDEEVFATYLARMRAADAMRHGVREDVAPVRSMAA